MALEFEAFKLTTITYIHHVAFSSSSEVVTVNIRFYQIVVLNSWRRQQGYRQTAQATCVGKWFIVAGNNMKTFNRKIQYSAIVRERPTYTKSLIYALMKRIGLNE